jgi:hypothetical protein
MRFSNVSRILLVTAFACKLSSCKQTSQKEPEAPITAAASDASSVANVDQDPQNQDMALANGADAFNPASVVVPKFLTRGCDVTVIESAFVYGKVLKADNVTPIAQAQVTVISNRYGTVANFASENNGKYKTVPAKTFCKSSDFALVCASAPGYIGQCSRFNPTFVPYVEVNLNLTERTGSTPPGACRYDVKNAISYSYSTGSGGCQKLNTSIVYSKISATTMDWTAAQSYCDGLVEGGFDDWRLASASEVTNAAWSQAKFIFNFDVANKSVWTSTATKSKTKAKAANFTSTTASDKTKKSLYSAVCTRTGF